MEQNYGDCGEGYGRELLSDPVKYSEGSLPVNFLKALAKVFLLLNPHCCDIPFMLRFSAFPSLIKSRQYSMRLWLR